MDYTTLAPLPFSVDQEKPEADSGVHSLYEALQALPDPRRGQGKRYSLALLLCLLLLAKLAGQTSLSGATEWLRHRGEQIAEHFGLPRKQMPCQMTYSRILARIDPQKLDELLAAFFIRWEAQQRCGHEPSRLQTNACQREHAQLAIDGKTVRATSKQEHPVHLLSCYDVITGTVLWQCNVEDKQNEISALKPLLTPSLIKGRIFSLDALHTQRLLCARIHRLQGDYVLIAKDNQRGLKEDIADLFEDRTPDRRRWQQAETWDKGRGRLEHRQILCSPDLNEWFGKGWEGIEQVFRLERTIRTLKTGEVHHEVVYGLSSLSLCQVPPARMLDLVRKHWAIENRLHWRRDVTLGEDACQTRTGVVPSLLARLNSTVLALMDRLGVGNVARQTRYFDAHLEQALHLLLTGSCSVF
ncbi:MAG TPA: ISAs1 family transposase [Ktedonobacteraceae bacterium]|nr:ISAs1 family transposase [Ktedonobacteraceae bacterium]